MRAVKIVLRTLSILIIAVLTLLLVANIAFASLRAKTGEDMPLLLGFSTAIVASGSMEPELMVYDMIITRAQDSYQVGDVISFKTRSSVTTHRIIEVISDESGEVQYRTRGDANNTEDTDPVSKSQIIGKVVLVLPRAGRVAEIMQTPLAGLCVLIIAALMLFAPSLGEKLKAGSKAETETKTDNETQDS